MPVLGYYAVEFRRKDDHKARVEVELPVGDGEHPAVDRAKEHLVSIGYDIDEWEVFYAKEITGMKISNWQYSVRQFSLD